METPTPPSHTAQYTNTSSLDRFAFYPNTAIPRFIKRLTDIDLERCADECLQQEAFLCRSFDFSGTVCFLSKDNSASLPLATYVDYDYYERIDIGPVSSFEIVPNSKLPYQNVEVHLNIMLEICAELCTASTSFYCASFEFNRFTYQCSLSNVSRQTANPPIRSNYPNNPYDYYERKTIGTKDPKIFCPSSDSIFTTSNVNYAAPTTDNSNHPPSITCDPPSGSLFPDGVSSVECTASDQFNKTASCNFNITVDTIDPKIRCSSSALIWSTSTVNYKDPIATDGNNPLPLVTCYPPSGYLFPDDVSTVECNSSDQANNSASCRFNITVDTIHPKIDCPSSDSIWSTSTVNYNEPIATDGNNPPPSVTCYPPSMSLFPEGVSTVECTSSDQANNTASCSFNITVDTTPPSITCPKDIVTEHPSPNWKEPVPTDEFGVKTTECNSQPNTIYQVGSANLITCKAEDYAQNTNDCSFLILIETDLTEEIANITLDVTVNNVDVVASQLDNITESAEVLKPADVVEVSNGLTDIVAINSTNKNVTEAVIDTIDNLFEYLDDNNTALIEASAVILGSLEQQVGTAASDGQNFTDHAENFAVQTSSFSSEALSSDVLFSVNQNTMQTNACFNDCQKKSDLSIKLPKNILKGLNGTQVNVSFVVFNSDALFPSKTVKLSNRLTSGVVLAATIYDESLPKVFDDPVELVFSVPTNLSAENASCVFWSETLRDWSNVGCISHTVEEDKITCQCKHLTNFAVLMFPQTNEPSPVKTFLDVVTIIGCSTSIICLIITLVTILSAKNIRSRQPQKIMINLCISLLCLYILFILGVDHAKPGNRGCTAVAVLVHYFLLTSASWTLVEAINMYFLFIKVFNLPGRKFIWIAACLAWGAPLLLVIVLSIASSDLYINETYCYINSSKGKLLLAFVILPFSVIIFCNIVIFVMVIRKLFLQESVPGKIAAKSGNDKKKRVLNAIAISSLLGLTWIFGFLAFEHAAQLPFLVLFCVFNSFQGAAIFYLFCFRQKECKDIWRSWFRGLTNKMSNTLRRMSVQDTSLFTVTDLSSSQKAETPASISLSVIHT
ncbi:adhesion G-protein coupled receptor G2-like [Anneissia japonica]|uniref:adhesion G-protein coupled receptor G2-like n=1 Tax=Anneissia japonica TaxID=1529436 RepID=UPI0014256225|nr:adhesion G-protein coupled receptor G2-like [Anneissia japonica]